MATNLTTIGKLEYTSAPGSVVLGVMKRTELTSTPIYDSADRTVVACRYSLNVEMTVENGGESTDSTMENLRKVLQTPGGQLHVSGMGAGNNIKVNVTGNQQDVRWGPKPRLLTWSPMGDRAAHVKWQCDFEISECDGKGNTGLTPMEFNYKVNYAIDRSGYTRRTISGHVRIPQTRKNESSRDVQYSADQIRERCIPGIPPGFRRASQDYGTDESKNLLTFSLVDEEMPPNAPPPGIIEVTASHDISSLKAPNSIATLWQAKLSASYEVAKDAPRSLAVAHFFSLMQSRHPKSEALDLAIKRKLDDLANRFRGNSQMLQQIEKMRVDANKIKTAILLQHFSASEPEIYGRRSASFSVSYTFLTTLEFCIAGAGLFKPTGGDYAAWQLSMENTAHHCRGAAGLKHLGSMDAIIDLCGPENQLTTLKPKLSLPKTGGRLINNP